MGSTVTTLLRLTTNLKANETLYVLWGVSLLVLTSQITIPLEPVPITLQTFGVLLLALTFEPKAAIKSIGTYLCLGALGAPVFAGFSGGAGVFLRATGGYLIGFFMAVVVITTLRKQIKTLGFFEFLLISLAGSLTIYSFGILGLLRFMDLKQAIAVGFLPFIISGTIKILLLSAVVKFLKTKAI